MHTHNELWRTEHCNKYVKYDTKFGNQLMGFDFNSKHSGVSQTRRRSVMNIINNVAMLYVEHLRYEKHASHMSE